MEEIQKLIEEAERQIDTEKLINTATINLSIALSTIAIAKMMALQMESSGTCKYCFSPRAGHCGGQYWCYKNYHSENLA